MKRIIEINDKLSIDIGKTHTSDTTVLLIMDFSTGKQMPVFIDGKDQLKATIEALQLSLSEMTSTI